MDDLDDETPGPNHVLRLLDGRGEPVSGVWVQGDGASHFTDGKGEVSFAAGVKPGHALFFDGEKEREVELTEPVTELRIDGVRTLDVGIVDGSTGAPLYGVRWSSGARSWGDARSMDGPALALPLDDEHLASACVRVEPPDGFGALAPYEWKGEVAARAKVVRVSVPVFPAREILFRTVDVDGRPVAGAEVSYADTRLAGERNPTDVTFRAEPSNAKGLLRIAGLPRVPLARLRVHVARTYDDDPRSELGATASGITLDEPGSPEPVTLVLVRQERSMRSTTHGWGRGHTSPSRPDSVAPLVVRALHRDGTPAWRVIVRGADVAGFTDRDGCVRFPAARTGVADFSVFSHGFTATAVRIDVGHDAEVVVREPTTRTVRVLVQDELGRALPAARVTTICKDVPGATKESVYVYCSVAQLSGDVELATPLTDREGRVELAVPVGTIEYKATLGGGWGGIVSADEFVRVVLHPQKD